MSQISFDEGVSELLIIGYSTICSNDSDLFIEFVAQLFG
jgi:hypothetical protein